MAMATPPPRPPPPANTWITSPVSWALVFLGWWMSPAISFYLNKFFSYLDFDASRKLRGLEIDTIPKLKQTLSDAEEQRMTRQDEDDRSESDLAILDKITKDLKSALHEAEDILDLVDYRLTEKRLTGHGPAGACISRFKICIASWERNLRGAADAHISCWKTSCSDQWRNIVIRVKLLRVAAGRWISRGKSCFRPPIATLQLQGFRSRAGNSSGADAVSTPAVSVQEVSMTIDAESVSSADAIFSAGAASIPVVTAEAVSVSSADAISNTEEVSAAVSNAGDLSSAEPVCIEGDISITTSSVESDSTVYKLRAWCNEAFGVRNNQEDAIIDSFLHTVSRIWLRKRIQQIEYILNDSRESHLLNQQSKNDSEIPINDTDKERRSTQEQIDDLYRKIELKVFGREKELERICGKFREISAAYGTKSCSSSKPYSVLGIHGIAGSGKSTLANYICDNEKMAKDKHFDLIMFSHVSATFRLEKIFCDMLRQISKDRQSDSKDIESLRNEVTEKLKGKRFLLVLDDLWVNDRNQTERDILLAALRAGKNGSIILVTAQREDAAAAIGAQDQDQTPIPDLEEDQYLSLFMHHALQSATDDDGEYKRIGRKIVGKLHRSPIAAVTVARRLQTNRNISYWEKAASLDMLNKTMGALWWSYQQLGADIRRCFAYLSTFPRGYMLRRDGLVHMWIAQGFVNTTSNTAEELEDVGLRYFEELLKFSFLQVINDLTISFLLDRNNFTLPSLQELNEDKVPEAFVIHDLLHELAERVAGSDFLRIDDLSVLPAKNILSGVRHLFIETRNGAQVAQIAERKIELGNLRTLIIMEPFEFMERNHEMEKILESLFKRQRKLRVIIMHLGHCPDVLSFPASIYQMKHLRYLGFHVRYAFLSDGNVMTLKFPHTFSKLYHMHTVFIGLGLSVSYPESMDNLIHLRHMYASTDLPNVDKLTSLQTMEYFHVNKKEQGYKLKQLKNLNKLRGYLKIVGLANVVTKEEALEAQLASKKRLTSLSLGFCSGTKASGIKAEVLEGLCPPKHLQKLTIEDYDTSKYPSWMLSGQHPDAPRHLHSLQLKYCSLLESIPEDSELFRHLRELNIHNCNGSSLPENMERLVSLQSLSISGSGDKMKLPPTLPPSLNKIRIKDFDWDSLPEHVKWPMSLQILDICYCNKIALLPPLPLSLNKIIINRCHMLSRYCREEGHENWHKIQHIPCKEITG